MLRQIYPNRWFIWTLAIIFAVFIYVEGEIIKLSIEQETESLLLSASSTPNKTIKSDTDTSSVSASSTQGWKTYRNEEFGFEFKYPSSYKIMDHGLLIFFEEEKINDDEDKTIIKLEIFPRLDTIEKVKNSIQNLTGNTTTSMQGKHSVFEVEEFGGGFSQPSYIGIFIAMNNGYALGILPSLYAKQRIPIVKKIISTFKFFEPN